ncbi:hypothetical protein [Neoroseomonas oryzicola]|uniref:Uncharacterized protein n=1 Tax=Neoroseomonas oryzicola TaxID=535904 RepID=A0A9X9WPH4_9PROT|nr:hypothetical protein [Neoroseomonas oryzicola]MBR0662234.1 hypothetical protein [Neoroseomonas oryzicola]NKE19756.1 hypothetical protein [Neoroseomonas oryzicola]
MNAFWASLNFEAFIGSAPPSPGKTRHRKLYLQPIQFSGLGSTGYRDRIVHIAQRPGEGGLSLGMDSATILKLSARGAAAAQLLVDRFHPRGPAARLVDFPMDWDNHPWVRYRTLMAAVERLLSGILRGAGDLPESLSSYRWPSEAAAERAAKAHSALMELAEAFEKAAHAQASATGDAPSLFDRLTPNGARSPHGGNSPRPKMGLTLQPIGRDPARSLPYP